MKNITTMGIDIAKNFIQLHISDATGKTVLKNRLARDKFLPFMANVEKCLVGMEACGGAHYWATELTKLGFEVKLMDARKVKRFVESHKNDAVDAKACAQAVARDDMRFVPIKTKSQVELQMLHRVRSYYVKQRTGLSNMMRGLLLEIGIAIPQGMAALTTKLLVLLADDSRLLEIKTKSMFHNLYEDLKRLNKEIEQYTDLLEEVAEEDEYCKRICTISGIGTLTATAVISKIGNGSEFKKGRELSACLGLVPRQHSSGDKIRLGGITKQGDRYVRQLLIHGARSSLLSAKRKNKITGLFVKQDKHSEWIRTLIERVGMNKASVAVANKNARMIVAVLKNKSIFEPALAH